MSKPEETNLAKIVGLAIARQRMLRGLTQEQVAEQLGIGGEAVSRIERGIVMPNI
jgi:transcriptional regulator with XRE-family HTH domain